jgi:hypothetical protein
MILLSQLKFGQSTNTRHQLDVDTDSKRNDDLADLMEEVQQTGQAAYSLTLREFKAPDLAWFSWWQWGESHQLRQCTSGKLGEREWSSAATHAKPPNVEYFNGWEPSHHGHDRGGKQYAGKTTQNFD